MIRPLRCHRRIQNFTAFNQIASWSPMDGTRPASVRMCYMPSIGMAYALGFYGSGYDTPDVFSNETFASNFILTPTGPGRMSRTPVPPDRMLIVRGFSGSVSSPPNPVLDFLPIFDTLRAKGVTLVIDPNGNGTQRPHSDIVPAASYSTVNRNYNYAVPPIDPVTVPRNNIVAETANYSGGDLFVVEMDWFGIFNGSYTRRITTGDSIDNFTTIVSGSQTKLVGCAQDVTYDEDLCKIELAKYRSFKQMYLYPTGDMTNQSTPADTIPNGYQAGFDFIKGTTFTGAALPYGDSGTNWPAAAAQIVALAQDFFA